MISCYILSKLSNMETLKGYIERFPLTNVSGYAQPSFDGLSSITKNSPKIAFIDVSLIDEHQSVLLKIGQFSTIIYISDNDSLAFKAFDTLGFDYFIMPLTFERFEMSMNKFIRLSLLAPSISFKKSETITDSFFVKPDLKAQKEVLIKCKDVIFIEALQNYVVIHMEHEKKFICHNTLKEMEDSLPESFFIRVHKSFIINYDRVSSVEGNNIILNENDKYKVLIGSTYRKPFLERKSQKMIKKKSFFQPFNYPRTASTYLFVTSLLLNCLKYIDFSTINLV